MSRVVLDDVLDLAFVRGAVLLKEVVRISLSGRIRIWSVQKFLNADKNLLDGDCRLPSFLLIQNRETDCARWVDVGMKERWNEFACQSC